MCSDSVNHVQMYELDFIPASYQSSDFQKSYFSMHSTTLVVFIFVSAQAYLIYIFGK